MGRVEEEVGDVLVGSIVGGVVEEGVVDDECVEDWFEEGVDWEIIGGVDCCRREEVVAVGA